MHVESLSLRVQAALERARVLARSVRVAETSWEREPSVRVVIGDPQAPVERFFAVLDARGLLGDDGRLRPDVSLISAGDHFDWGPAAERTRAVQSSLELVAWLADHPPGQVTFIAGNHDLARIGELADFDDASFAVAHELAVTAYRGGDTDPAREAELLERFPALPTAECAARDFAAFAAVQRDWILALLAARRLRVALAVDERTLVCHAGVTVDELEVLGMDATVPVTAHAVAQALNQALDHALAAWTGGPLVIPGLHRPGSRAHGEGGGMFYHRPCNPDVHSIPSEPYRRRFDPRRLPAGLVQIIGHIHDRKCRSLLGPWADSEPTPPGALRHLSVSSVGIRYSPGLPSAGEHRDSALLIFTDGAMGHTAPPDYELLDLAALARLL